MLAFLSKYGIEILLGLISAGALALCKYFHKKLKEIEKLYDSEEQKQLEDKIDIKLEPLYEELDELRTVLQKDRETEQEHMKIIISSYRYRLISLCKQFIKQGYITPEQYDQLTEFYKVYHDLGGNGQAKEYYEKALKLKVQNDDEEE